MSGSTSANAAESLLLRLPAELREIILRMVIGDGVIHVYLLRKRLKRSFCIAGDTLLPETFTWNAEEVLTTSGSAEDHPNVLTAIHDGCTHAVLTGTNVPHPQIRGASYRWDVLETCRLIYQEAFPIFWRTMRFCFQRNRALNQFLGRLTRAQKENLRQLVIIHNPWDSIDYEPFVSRAPAEVEWLVCNEKRGLFALKSLVHVELHLQIPTNWWEIHQCRTASINSSFELFENLRLPQLKKAPVYISYRGLRWEADRDRYSFLSVNELASLAKTFTQRLLNADQSSGAFLAEKLSKVDKSMREAESDPVLEREHKLKAFKMLADQDGFIASGMRQRLIVA